MKIYVDYLNLYTEIMVTMQLFFLCEETLWPVFSSEKDITCEHLNFV